MLIKECMAPREAYTTGTMARPSLFGGIDALEEESNHVVGLHHWLYEPLWCKSEFFGHR